MLNGEGGCHKWGTQLNDGTSLDALRPQGAPRGSGATSVSSMQCAVHVHPMCAQLLAGSMHGQLSCKNNDVCKEANCEMYQIMHVLQCCKRERDCTMHGGGGAKCIIYRMTRSAHHCQEAGCDRGDVPPINNSEACSSSSGSATATTATTGACR